MTDLPVTLVFYACHQRGGVERIVWETMRYLSRRHPVTVVAAQAETDGLENVTFDRIPWQKGPNLPAMLSWRWESGRRLQQLRRGVVVSYGATCPLGDVLVVNSVHRAWLEVAGPARLGGAPLPRWVRYAHPRHQALLTLEKWYFTRGRGRRIVAVSDRVAADLHRFYGVDEGAVTIIPNGYSGDQCSPQRAAALQAPMRARLGLHDDDVALLLVANEWHRKGLGVLLDAIALIRADNVHLLLVGRMPPDSYSTQVARLGLSSRVHYYGPADDVALYHAAADVFVMPTQYEAFSLATVEALASGLPVITTPVGGAGLVAHDVNGLIQEDPGDVSELAGLLRRALDADVRQRWRRQTALSVRDYEWSCVLKKMEQVLFDSAS